MTTWHPVGRPDGAGYTLHGATGAIRTRNSAPRRPRASTRFRNHLANMRRMCASRYHDVAHSGTVYDLTMRCETCYPACRHWCNYRPISFGRGFRDYLTPTPVRPLSVPPRSQLQPSAASSPQCRTATAPLARPSDHLVRVVAPVRRACPLTGESKRSCRLTTTEPADSWATL